MRLYTNYKPAKVIITEWNNRQYVLTKLNFMVSASWGLERSWQAASNLSAVCGSYLGSSRGQKWSCTWIWIETWNASKLHRYITFQSSTQDWSARVHRHSDTYTHVDVHTRTCSRDSCTARRWLQCNNGTMPVACYRNISKQTVTLSGFTVMHAFPLVNASA